ncbi:hypothetical protein T4B_5880 [Trichinella pseudospiralis]|uniref:Uncharacterized protein n=1 Tax=Trichinella pseudospiralis TaxID=6337 RepID=A0A0V1IUR5_TRIPS|nr:hypothetical protein T4B_5880 [Trichinella pseudospiralis]
MSCEDNRCVWLKPGMACQNDHFLYYHSGQIPTLLAINAIIRTATNVKGNMTSLFKTFDSEKIHEMNLVRQC